MDNAITSFRGQYDFLSNFYASPLTFEGAEYPTVEHAFQAAKSSNFAERRKIRMASTPSEAKRLGQKLKRRADWFNVSLQVLEALLRQKFTRYPDLRERLLATGDAVLIEGNNWNDRFYGCVYDARTGEWVGENHLGRLLMKIRDELKQQ